MTLGASPIGALPIGGLQAANQILPQTLPRIGGHPPAPYREAAPRSLQEAAPSAWVQRIVETVNNILQGGLNVVTSLTLTANASSTAIIDVRISAFSAITLTPLTANAAAELGAGTLYISSQITGQATITHASNAQVDRSYNVVIIG